MVRGFRNMQNPVVIFIEQAQYLTEFTNIRESLQHKTQVVVIEKSRTWAYALEPKAQQILEDARFSSIGSSDFLCSTYMKYEVLEHATKANYFGTKYTAWMDFSYLKYNASSPEFRLHIPSKMQEDKISYLQVQYTPPVPDPERIFRDRAQFVAGGFFIATTALMNSWAREYREYVVYAMEKGWTGVDNIMLAALLHTKDRPPRHLVQLHIAKSLGNYEQQWLSLGLHCIEPRR